MANERFIIYCIEMGCDISNPFHRTDDIEEAEIVCKDLAINNKVFVKIFDLTRNIDYYMVNPHFGKK